MIEPRLWSPHTTGFRVKGLGSMDADGTISVSLEASAAAPHRTGMPLTPKLHPRPHA